jgi:hypothetical protein
VRGEDGVELGGPAREILVTLQQALHDGAILPPITSASAQRRAKHDPELGWNGSGLSFRLNTFLGALARAEDLEEFLFCSHVDTAGRHEDSPVRSGESGMPRVRSIDRVGAAGCDAVVLGRIVNPNRHRT